MLPSKVPRLGFTDDASEDISCNIMPPLSYPTHMPTQDQPPFYPKYDNIYFPNGQKECLQATLLWPTLWAPEKRNAGIVYTNGLNGCVTARQNSQPECSVI